ncbi:hypothetical protein H1C71_017307 [Ictidomys tridecemlineatus]|nr:hypothetical protein H1C71_017307 [Ictidomys tridecemlineatus]
MSAGGRGEIPCDSALTSRLPSPPAQGPVGRGDGPRSRGVSLGLVAILRLGKKNNLPFKPLLCRLIELGTLWKPQRSPEGLESRAYPTKKRLRFYWGMN